ncbi:MAG: serine hydrolase [Hyphomicrobiales bacterium]|nr:serine hydrolase [Hyphomicrobiales bacterium]
MSISSFANPDLAILADNKARWNTPAHRRAGFQNLHTINRYGISLRSDEVLALSEAFDPSIGELGAVKALTGTGIFCGMIIVRGQDVLFEKYADDFGPDQPHTIMSISKTVMNLIIGELVAERKINLAASVSDYLPRIGNGYASATIQQVLNMDLENDYTEDYSDPYASSYLQEAVIGWRLPGEGMPQHQTQKEFLTDIRSDDIANRTGAANYKSANTDVLAWIAEEVSGQPMRAWLTDIVEAAGLEQALYMSTDREGFPVADGGGCLTARDLARLGLLFVRRGKGVCGRRVGNAEFIDYTREVPGPKMPAPVDFFHYSNQTMTDGTWIGHGGYGGQFMLANLDTGVVGVFFSVLENADAFDRDYTASIVRMLADIARDFG